MSRTRHSFIGLTLLLGAAQAVLGCVVPIGPEFEEEDNLPPFIHTSIPLVGEELEGPPNGAASLQVTVGDPNLNDHLFARWIFDYPKYDTNTSRIAGSTIRLEPTGQQERATIQFEPSCILHNVARGLTRHRLLLVVADREYVNPEEGSVPPATPLDVVPEGAHRVHAMWILHMECR